MLFRLAEIPVPLSQFELCPQTPVLLCLTFSLRFSHLSLKLIQPPFVCFLILKTILLTWPWHHLPGSPKLVLEAPEPCHLSFISACCCSSHFTVLQKQMNGSLVFTLLLKNSFIISYGSVSQCFTVYFWCSYRKPTISEFSFQQGVEKEQLFRSFVKSIVVFLLLIYVF